MSDLVIQIGPYTCPCAVGPCSWGRLPTQVPVGSMLLWGVQAPIRKRLQQGPLLARGPRPALAACALPSGQPGGAMPSWMYGRGHLHAASTAHLAKARHTTRGHASSESVRITGQHQPEGIPCSRQLQLASMARARVGAGVSWGPVRYPTVPGCSAMFALKFDSSGIL